VRRHDGPAEPRPVAAGGDASGNPTQGTSADASTGRTVPGSPVPRVAELDALLRDLDDLRLTLSTDLTLAAAALDADAPDVASTVIDSDRASLLAFEQRALRHLERLSAAAAVPPPAPTQPLPTQPVPTQPLPAQPLPAQPLPTQPLPTQPLPTQPPAVTVLAARRRSRVSGLLMPAAPLLAAAAAVLGVLGGVVPTRPDVAPATAPASTRTAVASYTELTRLTLDGADAARVRRAAERLHDELEIIVAQAGSDPVAAQEALALLESEARVLDSSADRDALTQVIAEARAMVARLKAALPPAPRTPRAPAMPVGTPDVRVFELPPAPNSGPPVPHAPEPSSAPSPSPEPESEPGDGSASPSSSPSSSTSAEPSEPEPSAEPSGNDSLLPAVTGR
jgi:hypothetical protein